MKRPDRFFHDTLAMLDVGDTTELAPRESTHAARVKRRGVGSEVELFDGCGRTARVKVVAAEQRRNLCVKVIAVDEMERPAHGIHVVTAVPKGDRMETMLDMLCQLGVARVTPALFEYSVPNAGSGRAERWRRVVIESCKQSRRNHLPKIDEPVELAHWLAAPQLRPRWLADPDGVPLASLLKEAALSGVDPPVVVVGPEGGVTAGERRALVDKGFVPVSLGDGLLRVETAAIAVAAAWSIQDCGGHVPG